MCIFGSEGVKIALFHTRWRSEEPMPLTDPGREKDLCTEVWDCIMQKVTSGREKRKEIALRTACANQPPAASSELTGQLQACQLLPACHFHKIVPSFASLCSPWLQQRSPGPVCIWCDSQYRKGWEALLPNVFLSTSTSEGWFSDVLHGCVPGSFSLCFHFQRTSKEEDTPINVLHDNKLGKHHFWMQLREDWLLPLPSGCPSWDYQMMSVVLNALLYFRLGKWCVCQTELSVLALKQSWHPVETVYFKSLILNVVLEHTWKCLQINSNRQETKALFP